MTNKCHRERRWCLACAERLTGGHAHNLYTYGPSRCVRATLQVQAGRGGGVAPPDSRIRLWGSEPPALPAGGWAQTVNYISISCSCIQELVELMQHHWCAGSNPVIAGVWRQAVSA